MSDAAIYEEVKKNLLGLRNFITENESQLRSGISAVAAVVPQVRHLSTNLKIILEQFRTTLDDVKTITFSDIELLMAFSGNLQSFLSRNPLLPLEPEHSADLVHNAQLLTGLNSLALMREELVKLTDDLLFQVHGLRPEEHKSAPVWMN